MSKEEKIARFLLKIKQVEQQMIVMKTNLFKLGATQPENQDKILEMLNRLKIKEIELQKARLKLNINFLGVVE